MTPWMAASSSTVSLLHASSNDLVPNISTAYHDVNGKVCHFVVPVRDPYLLMLVLK